MNPVLKRLVSTLTVSKPHSHLNPTTVFWGLFRPRRTKIVPYFIIGWMRDSIYSKEVYEGLGRKARYCTIAALWVWGLKRPQKTSNVSIFETVVRLIQIAIKGNAQTLHVYPNMK